MIGWDNLLRGKFVKYLRKVNEAYKKEQKAICKQKEKLQEVQEKEQEKYWDPTRPTKRKRKSQRRSRNKK